MLFRSPTAAGSPGWQDRRTTFRTRDETRALLIGCALGTSEDVLSGAVDFADLRLERTSERVLWDARARQLAHARRGWSAARRIGAALRAELRPSIVLLPEETLRFELRLPMAAPRFASGLGLWKEALVAGRTTDA